MTDGQPYVLQLTEEAEKDLKRLDKTVAKRIVTKLQWLAANAETYSHTALTGQWTGFFRLRVGDYRVIYALDHEGRLIVVVVIGHRSEI